MSHGRTTIAREFLCQCCGASAYVITASTYVATWCERCNGITRHDAVLPLGLM